MNGRVTIKDIAKAANVSVGTVDRVIHHRGRVNKQTREAVMDTLASMGYQTNKIASVLSKNELIKIALVIPGHNYFFKDIISGAQKACREMADYNVQLITVTQDSEKNPVAQLKDFEKTAAQDFNGIIVSPLHPFLFCESINEAVNKNMPVVTVNRDSPESSRLCYVGQNPYHAGMLAGRIFGKFLRGNGKVALLSGVQDFSPLRERTHGFTNAIRQEFPHIVLSDVYPYADDCIIAYEITKKLLLQDPSIQGVFADTTLGTIGIGMAIDELQKHHDKIAIGYDTQSEVIDLLEKNALTATITQNPFSQGYNAASLMNKILLDGYRPTTTHWYARADIIFHKEQILLIEKREMDFE